MSQTLYTRVTDETHAALVKIAKANDRPIATVAAQLVEIGVVLLQERGELLVERIESRARLVAPAPAKARR